MHVFRDDGGVVEALNRSRRPERGGRRPGAQRPYDFLAGSDFERLKGEVAGIGPRLPLVKPIIEERVAVRQPRRDLNEREAVLRSVRLGELPYDLSLRVDFVDILAAIGDESIAIC